MFSQKPCEIKKSGVAVQTLQAKILLRKFSAYFESLS